MTNQLSRSRDVRKAVSLTAVVLAAVLCLSSAKSIHASATDETYLNALVAIGTSLGDDGLYYFNLLTLIRTAADASVQRELAKPVPANTWSEIQKLPIVRSYRQMSEPDRRTLKAILESLSGPVGTAVKAILAAAAKVDEWFGEQTTGIDAFFALDDDNPERTYSVEDLHKVTEAFLKTTPADAFASAIQRPRFASNLLKYHAR